MRFVILSVPNAFDGQSHNAYSYVLNNPVRYVDPTGHAADDAGDRGGGDPLGGGSNADDGDRTAVGTDFGPSEFCKGDRLVSRPQDPDRPNHTEFDCTGGTKTADASSARNGPESGLDAASRAKVAEMPRDPSCSVLLSRQVYDGVRNPSGARALSVDPGSLITRSPTSGWQGVSYNTDFTTWAAFSSIKTLGIATVGQLSVLKSVLAKTSALAAVGAVQDGLDLQMMVEYDSVVVSDWYGVVDVCLTKSGLKTMPKHFASGPPRRAISSVRSSYKVSLFGASLGVYGPDVLLGEGFATPPQFPTP